MLSSDTRSPQKVDAPTHDSSHEDERFPISRSRVLLHQTPVERPMTHRVEVVARGHARIAGHDSSRIEAWGAELFAEDAAILDAYTWQDKRGMGFNIQTYLGDEIVGFAHVFARLARRDDQPVQIGCLGSVMTDKTHQGTGIGTATVNKANDVVLRNLRADMGVLLCKRALVSFYEPLGWQRMGGGAVLIDQPQGKMVWPHEGMVLLRDDASYVPNRLDLGGLPF